MCVQCCRNCGIDAAGNADHDFCQAGLLQKPSYTELQTIKDAVDAIVIWNSNLRRWRGLDEFFQAYRTKLFAKRLAMQQCFTVDAVGCAATVECIDGFAIVLDADIIDVNQRGGYFAGHAGKNPVALVVFSQRERRAGQIDKQIDRSIPAEDRYRFQCIVIAPTIFAQQTTDLQSAAITADRQGQ